MKKKLLTILLVLCMVVTMLPGAALAAEFDDVEGHWGQEAIERWADYGVLNGNNGAFRPNDVMTRAEFATMLVNMMGYTKTSTTTFTDLNPNAWYADAMSKLVAAGVMNGVGGGRIDPTGQITREQAAVMLCRAFGIKASGEGSINFQDSGKVSPWAVDAMTALSERGMINGVGNNTLSPDGIVNRATAAKLTSNMVAEYVTSDTVLTGEIKGVVIVAKGATVEIKDAVVTAPIVVESASVSLVNTKAEEVKVAGEKAAVTADKDSSVTDVSVGGEAPAVEINGTIEGTVTVEEGATAPEIKGDGVKAEQVVNNTDADVTVNGETVAPEEKPAAGENTDNTDNSDNGDANISTGPSSSGGNGSSEGETPVDPDDKPTDAEKPEENKVSQEGKPEDTAPTDEEETAKKTDDHQTHNYVADESDSRNKTATCTQFGVEVLKCECGLEKVNNIDKVDHVAKDTKNATDSVAATCVSKGYDSFDCKICNAKGVKITETAATGAHTYSTGWVQGGSDESPVHYHQCKVCGEPDEESQADCTATKWTKKCEETHTGTCSVCKRAMTALHEMGETVYAKNGDCTRGVSYSVTCAGCGYKKTSTTEASENGHNYGDDGVCTNEGCAQTKPEDEKPEEDPCKDGHTVAAKGATSKGASGHEGTCSVCDKTVTVEHESVSSEAVAATCTEAGKTAGVTCACGYTTVTTGDAATGHSWEDDDNAQAGDKCTNKKADGTDCGEEKPNS